MKISLDCNISLSKKIRSIIGEDGDITLTAISIKNGRGTGKVVIESNTLKAPESIEEISGETSIMFTPTAITKQNPPSNKTREVATIFSSNIKPIKSAERTVIDRLAATEIPEEIQHAIVAKEEIQTPEPFKTVDIPKCKEYITNLQELYEEVNKAKNKSANIDLDSISNLRQRALEAEKKEQLEAIDKPAYIVNDKVGVLTINDLNITLSLNCPYDLSRISAKRIAASNDLKELLKTGYIKFVPLDQVEEYVKAVEKSIITPSLEVFDNHRQAERNMANLEGKTVKSVSKAKSVRAMIDGDDDDESEEWDANSLEKPTEDERMIMDLTSKIGTSKQSSAQNPRSSTIRSSNHSG